MNELGKGVGFAYEPCALFPGGDDLDRGVVARAPIDGLVHGSHAARARGSDDLEPTADHITLFHWSSAASDDFGNAVRLLQLQELVVLEHAPLPGPQVFVRDAREARSRETHDAKSRGFAHSPDLLIA